MDNSILIMATLYKFRKSLSKAKNLKRASHTFLGYFFFAFNKDITHISLNSLFII